MLRFSLVLSTFFTTILSEDSGECTVDTDGSSTCTSDDTNHNNNNNDDYLDPNDPDFDLLNFDASAYDYGEFPCPGLSAGWTCDYSVEFSHRNGDHFFCDADIVQPDISVEEFNRKYLFRRPVLINTTIEDWANTSFWSKKSLLKNYGNFLFEAGRSLELVLNSGIGSIAISLRDWLKDPMSLHLDADVSGPHDAPFKEPLYIFDRSIWNEESGFKNKHFHGPPYLANGDPEYGILFLGGTGTGATWHGHGETWAAEAYGRKRWFFYPPEITPPGGFWPGYSAKDWFFNVYPYLSRTINMSNEMTFNIKENYHRHSIFERLHADNKSHIISKYEEIFMTDSKELNEKKESFLYKPIECIQAEGQLIYLPEFWFHAVLNLGDVVAAGIQTSNSYTQWMQEIDKLGRWEKEINFEGQKALHKQPLNDLEHEIRKFNLVKLYERMKEMSPNNAVRYFMTGVNYEELGQSDQATKLMTEALKMDPAYIEAYSNLGAIYMQSESPKQRRKGEHLWRIAYMLNHNNPRVRENLMDLFNKDGRKDLAELVSKHEKLPPMEDEKEKRRNEIKEQQEARRKFKESLKQQNSENSEMDESMVMKGNVKTEHYGSEDVIDDTIPEPSREVLNERIESQKNEIPQAAELGSMRNSII